MSNRITEDQIVKVVKIRRGDYPTEHTMLIFRLREDGRLFGASVVPVDGAVGSYEICPIPLEFDNYIMRKAYLERMQTHGAQDLVQPETDSPDVT